MKVIDMLEPKDFICVKPDVCAEEAIWMFNPCGRWHLIEQPICYSHQGARQGVCYASPKRFQFLIDHGDRNSYSECEAKQTSIDHNKYPIWQRLMKLFVDI